MVGVPCNVKIGFNCQWKEHLNDAVGIQKEVSIWLTKCIRELLSLVDSLVIEMVSPLAILFTYIFLSFLRFFAKPN